MSILLGVIILLGGIIPSCFVYGAASINAPTEATILEDINERLVSGAVKHPYIHATNSKIEQIKAGIESGDEYSLMLYNEVLSDADELLELSVISVANGVSQSHIEIESRIIKLMTAYFVSGSSSYLNRAISEFTNLQTITKWTAAAQLDNTQTAASIAICYDWLYNYLSDEQKNWAVETIKEKSLDIAYRYYKDPTQLSALRAENDNMNIWCWRGSYNHCVYNNSNLAVAALAIAPVYPEYAAYILYNNLYNIQPYFELVGDSGGHEEPVGYYGYTTGKAINMLSAVSSALGTMYGYENYPGFKSTAYYPLYMYGAGAFSFGDTSPSKAYYDTNFLYFAAKHSKNNGLMKLLSQKFEKGDCAKLLLWYDKGELDNISESEKLPFDRMLSPASKGQNVAVFRDGWDIDSGLYAAMYAGCATANGHSDASSGAFCLDAFGERFVTPIGAGNYDYPGYWENAQNGRRWNWYEKRPEGANCLVINPSESVGQDVSETAVIDIFESGDASAYAVTDLSGVYKDYVKSYSRGMKIHNNRTRIVVQDEAEMKAASKIFWSFNTPAEIEITSDNTAILTNNGKQVAVKLYANTDIRLFEMEAEKLSTSPVTAEQRSYPGYRKLAFVAENVTQLNLMAEFTPIVTEFEMPDGISDFMPISEWNTDEIATEKPTLDAIYIDGTPVDNFKPSCYNYELIFDTLPDEEPQITFDNSKGYDVDVTFTESGEFKAILTVSSENRTAYYVIKLTQLPPSGTVRQTTLNYKKFASAMYETDDATSVGTASSDSNGWLPYLYTSGVYRHYYCSVDISSLNGTEVTSGIYNLFCGGKMDISVYSLDGDFTPGITAYGNLPLADAPIGEYKGDMGNGGYVTFDFTSHINKLLSSGKTKLGFVIVQNEANTTHLANESSYTEWRPYISISYMIKKEPLVISDITLSDASGYTTAEVSLKNNSGLCFGGYMLILAEYSDNRLVNVSIGKSGRIMPYRTCNLSAKTASGAETKAFLWNISEGLVPIKFAIQY